MLEKKKLPKSELILLNGQNFQLIKPFTCAHETVKLLTEKRHKPVRWPLST